MPFTFSSRHRAATLALALCAAPAVHAQTTVPTFTVSSSAELATLLQAITTDTLILLNPGNYGNMSLLNVRSGRNVTIRSRYATNRAKLGRVYVRSSSRIRFDQVNFQGPRLEGEGAFVSTVVVRESDMVHFTNCNFWGSLNNNANDDGVLLRFMASTNAVVINSVFREARVAITAGGSTYMNFIGNNIAVVREGVNLAGTQVVSIDRNFIRSVFPNTAEGDHSDAIQVFTGTATRPTKSVQMTNNAILLANSLSQGIFIRNESGNATLSPASFTILNNVYFGNVRHAITASDINGVTIRANTVVPSPVVLNVPAITANNSVTVVTDRNITPMISSNVAYTSTKNTFLATSRTTGVDIAAQFVGAVNIEQPAIASFQVAVGSTAALNGSGFVPVSDIGGMSLSSAATHFTSVQTRLRPLDGRGIFPTM